jgi:hypothetical protein
MSVLDYLRIYRRALERVLRRRFPFSSMAKIIKNDVEEEYSLMLGRRRKNLPPSDTK